MTIADYKGPANSPEIFRHLVGVTVKACFQVPATSGAGGQGMDTYIVDESGTALVFHHATGAYWKEPKEGVDAIIAARRAEIERKLAELNDLPGADLSKKG